MLLYRSRIKQLVESSSYRQLCAATGLPRSTINGWVLGEKIPYYKNLVQASEVLDLPVPLLLVDEDDNTLDGKILNLLATFNHAQKRQAYEHLQSIKKS